MTESQVPVPKGQVSLSAQDVKRSATREFVDIWNSIPPDVRDLLFVSKDRPKSFGLGVTISIRLDFETGNVYCEQQPSDDPSTIYLRQGLVAPTDISSVPRPSYYPSYAGLSPEQRYLYLSWLRNVLSPVDIGFAFIFYYGLERQLLLGNFDAAFDMILRLREFHINPSFQGYSFSGLVYGSIFRNKPDKMTDLLPFLSSDRWENGHLLICAKLHLQLSAEEIARVIRGVSGINRHYLKDNREDYIAALADAMEDTVGARTLYLDERFPISSLQRHKTMLFANYTFPEEVRNAAIPDFTKDPGFDSFLKGLHAAAHDRTKAKLQTKRRQAASGGTSSHRRTT